MRIKLVYNNPGAFSNIEILEDVAHYKIEEWAIRFNLKNWSLLIPKDSIKRMEEILLPGDYGFVLGDISELNATE